MNDMGADHADYGKRDYLLPAGCKDIVDALKLQKKGKPRPDIASVGAQVVHIPSRIDMANLASLLSRRPGQIASDLVDLGVNPFGNPELTFDVSAALAAIYGFVACEVDVR